MQKVVITKAVYLNTEGNINIFSHSHLPIELTCPGVSTPGVMGRYPATLDGVWITFTRKEGKGMDINIWHIRTHF